LGNFLLFFPTKGALTAFFRNLVTMQCMGQNSIESPANVVSNLLTLIGPGFVDAGRAKLDPSLL
jgi:hypothetical protein